MPGIVHTGGRTQRLRPLVALKNVIVSSEPPVFSKLAVFALTTIYYE